MCRWIDRSNERKRRKVNLVRIIVGLGNPGKEYAATRHNVGFMILDQLARDLSQSVVKTRFKAALTEGVHDGQRVVLVAPQAFMNLSGHSVREVKQWFKAPLSQILVVLDDLDLPFGELRMRMQGSPGGHNGMRSIIEQLGSSDVPRLRVGIGRGRGDATGHVLTRFSKDEEAELPEVVDRAAAGVWRWSSAGILAAMNELNQKPAQPVPTSKASS